MRKTPLPVIPLVVIFLVVLLGLTLALMRGRSAKTTAAAQASATAAQATATPPYPNPPGPIPTLPDPTQAASCPLGQMTIFPNNGPSPGYHDDETVPGVRLIEVTTSGALGMVTDGWVYTLIASEVTAPAAYANKGVIHVQVGQEDICAFVTQHPGQTTPKSPIQSGDYFVPGQSGAITFTTINGAVIEYKTAAGQTGHFNYVTGTFGP